MLGGTVRWMARELLAFESDGTPQRHDRATDVWAYGMVVYVCDPCSNSTFQYNFKFDVPLGTAFLEGSVWRETVRSQCDFGDRKRRTAHKTGRRRGLPNTGTAMGFLSFVLGR